MHIACLRISRLRCQTARSPRRLACVWEKVYWVQSTTGDYVRSGEARQGKVRCGEARQGEARRGEARSGRVVPALSHLLCLEPSRAHVHEHLLSLRREAEVVGLRFLAPRLLGRRLCRSLSPISLVALDLRLLQSGFQLLFAEALLEGDLLPLAVHLELGPRHLLHDHCCSVSPRCPRAPRPFG